MNPKWNFNGVEIINDYLTATCDAKNASCAETDSICFGWKRVTSEQIPYTPKMDFMGINRLGPIIQVECTYFQSTQLRNQAKG
ncbi:hypothetical protein T12_9084 [Trichinella patagoniensis]|uniref:Uncharacterized protein n=1 Tax=Trichinella patagoniensis TaxID=990121 RepID=A0A0V1ACP4_9BILA|nr:hypothetical protein T12_9084 [Trichinella patagoniensis]